VSTPKSHHYVPRAYLRRFVAEDGFLRIFDVERSQIRRQRPEKVMKIDGYYRQEWAPAGIDPNILEKRAGEIEGNGLAAMDRLCFSPEKISGEEAADLCAFLEFQRVRVPRQAAWAAELARTFLLRTMGPELRDELARNRLQVTVLDPARFDFMRTMLGKIHPWMERMNWEVVEAAPGSAFITTDSPVTFVNRAFPPHAEAGIGLAGTVALFPLSSRKLLFMTHPEAAFLPPDGRLRRPKESDMSRVPLTHGGVFDREKVRQTNWYMAHTAHHLCVAESEAALSEAFSV